MRTAEQSLRVTGLRDYRWAFDLFPGKVGPTDLDCVVHREDGNRFLVMEFKRSDEALGRGQERLLAGLARLPEFTAAVVRETDTPNEFHIGQVGGEGVACWFSCSLTVLKSAADRWWTTGLFFPL